MKKVLTLTTYWSVSVSLIFAQASYTKLTADEIFEKVVQYYDPNDIWDQYQGSMKLISIFVKSVSEEEIMIDNAHNSYQSVIRQNDSTFVKGIKNENLHFEISNNKMTEAEIPEKFKKSPFNLTSHSVKMLKEHHTYHFSGPLMLKARGAKPSPEVGSKVLFGTTCVSITFPEGLPDNYPQGGYNGAITLYVIPAENYKLHGIHLDNGWWKDEKGLLTIYSGEIEINGLKIPSRRLYFNAADHSYQFIDAFAPMNNPKQ